MVKNTDSPLNKTISQKKNRRQGTNKTKVSPRDEVSSEISPVHLNAGKAMDEEDLPEEDLEVLEPSAEDLTQNEIHSDRLSIAMDVEVLDESSEEPLPERHLPAITNRSLVPFDALQAYVHQAKQYPLLSVEEEHSLAVRYKESGDLEAARRLVTANLRLVIKIAHEYRKAYRNLLDLVQEGNIGLMHAVKKFDPYRGVKLSSYASWWIRAYILKFILNNWRMVKIGTTQAQRKLFYNLRKEVERLEAMGIEQPTPKLLAERLSVPEEEVKQMQRRLASSDLSLDAPLNTGEPESASRIDFVRDHKEGPDSKVENEEFSKLLQAKLAVFKKTLRGREKDIFELRSVADEPKTLQEIGDMYGITRERARQIERRMMDRLKAYLKDELGNAVNVALGLDD